MNVQFIPNNPETRKKLVEGALYLTIYQGATTICRSVYAGNDSWKNPGTQEFAKNSVAFFASASVFDIPDFKGWNAEADTIPAALADSGEDKLCACTMDDVERRIGEVNGRLHELESRQALVDLLEGHKSNWVPDSKGGEKNCFINEHFRALYMEGRK